LTARGAVTGVALVALIGLVAACSGGSSKGLPASQVEQRYDAAIGPANTAIASLETQAVAAGAGGSAKGLASASGNTSGVLQKAAGQVSGISAAPPLEKDMADVVKALNNLVTDLAALSSARGADVPPAAARYVADAGREAAADELVKLALIAATTPTTLPPPTVAPDTTTTVATLPPPPTTVPRHTTTTRRTATTLAHTATTLTP
jgi:hypothetical protein